MDSLKSSGVEAAKRLPPCHLVESGNEPMGWQFWQAGAADVQIEGISPLVAQWEKNSSPAKIRLLAYLDELTLRLSPFREGEPLFLELGVDVQDEARLLHEYDLENYLTPLFSPRHLPWSRFFLVKATKYVGGGSRIAWGRATPAGGDDGDWSTITIRSGTGAPEKAWKERLRIAVEASRPAVLPPGAARVRLAWRCGAHRAWSSFWKPTGDAMGAILGVADPSKPYHLDDDRILDLEFHRNLDDRLGHAVDVGMWWRAI